MAASDAPGESDEPRDRAGTGAPADDAAHGSGPRGATGRDAGDAAAPADDGFGPTVILPTQEAGQGRQAGTGEPAAAPSIPSWFGKLPFLGDFASRRLPESFIRPWDEWLQPGLAAGREASGDRWLDLYLTFPVWRFVMPAGLLGESSWIGVLLPSVDRVGRCFPLTICEPIARSALEEAGLIGIDLRLATLADAGIEALDADSVDFLEQRLAALGAMRAAAAPAVVADTVRDPAAGPSSGSPAANSRIPSIPLEAWLQRPRPGQDPIAVAWPLAGTIPAVLAGAASRFVVAALRDRVLWWSPADEAGGTGALLLEPFPFSSGLLGRLIGTS